MAEHCDIALVGGGMVGLVLASALTSAVRGVSLAILDRRPLDAGNDARASAISPAGRRLFGALGLWERLEDAATPVAGMKITDSGAGDISRPLFLTFEGGAAGEPLAWMVPNRVLSRVLLDAIDGAARVLAPAQIVGMTADASSARPALADGGEISAPLGVAADGGNSALRAMAGIGVVSHDYRQSGVVTTIGHELPHDGLAWEHFRPAGPFASLPLAGNRSSLVWTETPAEAARLRSLSREAAAIEIEAAMGSCLGTVTVEEPLQAFPLKLVLARSFIGPRLALVGDAAHVIHPLAGQGLNLGLKDVAALAETVTEAMRLGLDHGGPAVLEGYQRWRRFDTALMAATTDNLNRLFSNDAAPLRVARDLGLAAVDRMPAAKNWFTRRAAGIEAGGPRLLAGLPL